MLVLGICALVCPAAFAADQYARYNGACSQGGQRVVTNGVQSSNFFNRSFPSCTVTVFIHGTLNKATLFTNAAGTTPLLNPFTATTKGDASWYAPDARYDVQYSGGVYPNNIPTPFSIGDIQLCFSCSGGAGGSSNATQLQGVPISVSSPASGQFLGFNGSVWGPTTITGFLPLTGGTLTGPLVLFGNPIGTNDAANKGYVDTRLLAKADLVSGIVPTNELGSGAASITTCLAGNSSWQPCGGGSATFPFAAPDSSAPQFSFVQHTNVGVNSVLATVKLQVLSIQVTGSAGNQTITAIIATPIRALSWDDGDTFQFASLPSNPTDLTSLNGHTYTIPVGGVVGNTPTSTITFTAPTSIGVSTYTVATGTAQIWDGFLQGHAWAVNRLDTTTAFGAEHGSIRFARRDAVVSRTGFTGLSGIDNVLLRGSQQFTPVNAVGTGTLSISCTVAANCLAGATSISITKGAGANWLAKGPSGSYPGDLIEIAHPNGDAEKQDYYVAADTTVVQGTTTTVPITPTLPGTGLSTSLTAGDLIVATTMQAQCGDASGCRVLGQLTALGDLNVYGNINQLGTGAWQTSGVKQAAVTVTVPQGKDFSLFLGSDNLFHCQLSSLLGGGSCGGGGSPGVTSVGLAVPNAFTVSGSPVTGASTITIGYGSGQIPIANLATGTPTGLKFIRDDGTLVAPLTFNVTPVSVIAVTSPITGSTVGNTLTIACANCLPFTGALVNGDLLMSNGSSQALDSTVVAANVVTASAVFTSGNIPKAAGANKTLSDGYGVQGTDTKLLTSGTIAGTGATLCTDALGGATTSGCSSGSSVVQISGTPAANQVSVWTNATTIQGLTATGTLGSPVFSVSPTLVTPVLGIATATTINKVTITSPATGSTITVADGKTATISNTITLTGTDGASLNVTNAVTAAAVYTTSGNLIQVASSTTRTTSDSGIIANQVVTSVSNFISGHVPIAGGTNRTLTDGFGTQGTDTNLLTSGTVSGVGNILCVDANGGATTVGCVGGGSGNTTSTALTTNTIPVANGANSIIDSLLQISGQQLVWTGTGGIKTGTSGTGQWIALEGPAPSGILSHDLFYASDATGPAGGHRWAMKNNNGSADTVVGANTTDTFNNKLFDTALTGNVLKINGQPITNLTGNTVMLASASGTFTSGNLTATDANHNVIDTILVAANVASSGSSITSGNVLASGGGHTIVDGVAVAANLVTASAVFVSGHIPKAAGANRTLSDGYGVQGTDTNLITSGTIAGTSVLVCTDANGGITTSSCPSPTATAGGADTQLQYNNATALGGISQFTTNGTTTITGSATAVFNMGSASVTAGLKIPIAAGAAPTADGFISINTTTHAFVHGSNGTTIVSAAAATGTNTSTSCTNQVVTVISSVAIPTCSTLTLASAMFANQGTTTTVLHGNAAGNPAFGPIVAADITANTITSSQVNGSIANSTSAAPATLTDGATITWAIASVFQANATVTLGGNRTLNITGPVSGGTYILRVVQDGTGSRTLTLGTGCTWKVSGGGAGAITLSTAINTIDVLSFYYDGTNCYANLNKNFS